MFRIIEDPSSGSLVQYLAKNYKNDFIVSVVMDMVLWQHIVTRCACVGHCAFIYGELHTRTSGQNMLP